MIRSGRLYVFRPAEGPGLFGADAILHAGAVVRAVSLTDDGRKVWIVQPVVVRSYERRGWAWSPAPCGEPFRAIADELDPWRPPDDLFRDLCGDAAPERPDPQGTLWS